MNAVGTSHGGISIEESLKSVSNSTILLSVTGKMDRANDEVDDGDLYAEFGSGGYSQTNFLMEQYPQMG